LYEPVNRAATLALANDFFYAQEAKMELIKIETRGGIETVNARELHTELESRQDFSTWIKSRIEDFEEGIDYLVHKFVDNPKGGRPTIDYYLTIEASKHVAMMERNDQGKKIRQYFIEVENRAREISKAPQIPQTYAEALRLAADQAEQIEAQKTLLIEQAPKVEAYNTLIKTDTMMSLSNACKHFGIQPIKHGIPSLKYHGYLTTKNLPTQRAIDLDIMKLKETVGNDSRTHMQAVVEACQLVKFGKVMERITKEDEI
jgi:anti-repressor protein